MTQIGNAYAEALYSLAKEEDLTQTVLDELKTLKEALSQEPEYLRLLASPNLTKQERCGILDESFRGRVHPYVLNFMKILTEKGYARHFGACCDAYRGLYNEDHGILPVSAVTAVALRADQAERLSAKLAKVTGKTIELTNRIDPDCLGGIRLDYDGKRVDGTVSSRLEAIRSMLKNTVL